MKKPTRRHKCKNAESTLRQLQINQERLAISTDDSIPGRPVVDWSDPVIQDLYRDAFEQMAWQGFSTAS